MSDVTKVQSRHAVYAGLTVDIAEESLGRVSKLLSGINGGLYKAVGSALTRSAAAGRTVAKRAVTKEYSISSNEFLSRTKNINHFVKDAGGNISVEFGFRGYVIPLLVFNTKFGKDGRIVTQVKREKAASQLDHAFVAQVGGHRGVFEREGDERFPIHELYGPATPQMMYSNEDVLDEMEAKMADTYEKRIEHELMRVMNGW